jgi:hypothetical protein
MFERPFRLDAGDAFAASGPQRGPTASASPLATLLNILECVDRGGFVWTPRPFEWKCAKSHQLHAPRAKN